MSKNQEFVKFDKVDKSYDGKVLVVKDLNLDMLMFMLMNLIQLCLNLSKNQFVVFG